MKLRFNRLKAGQMSPKQKGMALLTILLLIAVMIPISVLISERWFSQLQQTHFQQRSLQAKWYAIAAEEVIRGVLWRDLKDDPTRTHLGQYWSSSVKQFPLEDALLKFELSDGSGCFNLNGINHQASGDKPETEDATLYIAQVLEYLISEVGVDGYRAQELVVNLQDWIDADEDVRPYGAEDTLYGGLNPAYLTANHMLFDISELRLINGFTPEIIQKIKPYVCVLPKKSVRININTVTEKNALLLSSATLGQWDQDFILTLIGNRPKNGWSDLNTFYEEAGLQSDDPLRGVLDGILDVNSQFFMAKLRLQLEDNIFTTQSLFYRTDKGISVVNRRAEAISE